MFLGPTRRLQHRRQVSVDHFNDQATQRTGHAVLGAYRAVIGQRREVDSQIESLTAVGANEPRTGSGAGGQLCWTDSHDERGLLVVSNRRI